MINHSMAIIVMMFSEATNETRRRYVAIFAVLLKRQNVSSHQLNSNNRYSFVFEDYFSLGIETFFCRRLPRMATYKGSAP